MECNYCKNNFKTISSLNFHQKNAKYCIKIQEKNTFSCDACFKKYTTKRRLNTHLLKCEKINDKIETMNNYIQKLKNEINTKNQYIIQLEDMLKKSETNVKTLQDKLENVAISAATRPTNIKNTHINNYIQKLEITTDDSFDSHIDNLTIAHIQKGPLGYAEYALEYPLKNKIACVDYARRKVKYKNKDGNVITDPDMTTLATKLFKSIKDKNKNLIVKYGNELKENFNDNIESVVELLEYKMSVNRASEGEKGEFYNNFVKNVCDKTVI